MNKTDNVSLKTWIGVWGTMLGAFMAVLDIQITNASLQDIQAALGATLEEGSWISTSYLVAEIVVIPLTGWLSQVFSMRRYLLVNAGLFVVFSVLCMSFTVLLTTLPQSKQPTGMALFGITATFAPSIGPTLGGWLTDNFSWHYIFYLNLIPGLLLLAAVWYAIDSKPMQLHLLKQGDWWGIASMAIGLASLQVVLEEGNRKDWFGSPLIVRLAILAAIFIPLFFAIELTSRKPFINLRLLKNRNFGLASIVNVGLGLGLYGSVYILPLYLSQIQGYNALQIGEVMMWVGLPQLILIPFVPKLMQRFDIRLLIAIGVGLFALSCFINSSLTQDTGLEQLRFANIVRALGQPLILVPLSTMATANIPKEQAGSASGLFNMMRNLGGSFGIAAISTLLTRRENFHSLRLGEAVSLYDPQTQQRLEQLTQLFVTKGADLETARDRAIAAIDQTVRTQSYILAYEDCFYAIALALMLSGLAILFFKKVRATGATPVH
jgi:MFS transporter, DHA2 family, multidrug resistance protein